MMRVRTETRGDPVTVEGRDRSPRGAWRWAIAVPLATLMIGIGLLWYSLRGSGGGIDRSSPVARVAEWLTVVSAVALAVVVSAENLINWNRRDTFSLRAGRDGISYRAVSAGVPEQLRRWTPEQVKELNDTDRGLRLTLSDGQHVDLPLGRSSEDSRKLADEVTAAIGRPRKEST